VSIAKGAYPEIKGYCPMGCGSTLFLGEGGFVTCSWINCPDPEAVTKILEGAAERDHTVLITETMWTMQHPLRERVENDLFQCEMGKRITNYTAKVLLEPGLYRISSSPPWDWERITSG
jgi:hypothetical protein